MQVHNLLRINISGQGREVKLDNVLLQNAVPMSIQSPLPAKLGPSGELFLQARPGRWDIDILTRFDGPIREIGPVNGAFGQEVWSFQAQNQLRMVQIEGVPGSRSQTNRRARGLGKLPHLHCTAWRQDDL